MESRQSVRITARIVLLVLAISIGSTAGADGAEYRIAFEDVPGSPELESGMIKNGIEILEAAYAEGRADEGEALATLCGAYLLDKAMQKAKSVCRQAATRYPGKVSLNNYGIYLAVVGDFEGAIESFRKVQPLQLDEYLEYLRTKDIGLIALQNESVVQDYRRGRISPFGKATEQVAKLEDMAL